jgi:hypothetical protein
MPEREPRDVIVDRLRQWGLFAFDFDQYTTDEELADVIIHELREAGYDIVPRMYRNGVRW